MANYIPNKNVDFDSFQANLITIVSANSVVPWAFTATQLAALAALVALQTIWSNAWAISQVFATSTPTDRFNTEQARINFEAAIREFVKSTLKYNPAISDTDRELMGVTVDSNTRTHLPPPAFAPVISSISKSAATLVVTLKIPTGEPGDTTRTFPIGSKSAILRWKIDGETPLADWECSNVQIVTKVSTQIEFTLPERGKPVYFMSAYLSTTDEQGPWSAPFETVIP